jgi:succinate dehydrogenase / fumarate reductase cytochrome b subunit
MKWSELFTSSIGKKWVMAITGLCLIMFLVVHVTVNSLIWAEIFVPADHGEIFNKAAHFLGATMVPRILEIGLFLFFFLHIIQGFTLELQNRSKRGVGYKVGMGAKGSQWYKKSMGLLGTLIFLFLIIHLAHFWVPSRFGGLVETTYAHADGKEYHNLYAKMIEVFQELWVVVLYVLGCISLAWHLIHGFQSGFRTLGVSNKRYLALLNALGIGFSLVVSILFAMMPISIYLGWIN